MLARTHYTHLHAFHTYTYVHFTRTPGSTDENTGPARPSGWDPGHSGTSNSRAPGGSDSEGGGHHSASLWRPAAAHRQEEWLAGGGGRWQSWRSSAGGDGGQAVVSLTPGVDGTGSRSLLEPDAQSHLWKFATWRFIYRGLNDRCSTNPNRWYLLYATLIIEKIRSGPCTATTLMSEGTCSPICYLLV